MGQAEADQPLKVASPTAKARALLHAAKRKSTDSSTSGIVWSAVVEKFSEMAQEIAGNASPKKGERRSNLSVASTIRSDRRASVQTVASTIRPSKTLGNVTSPIREEELDESDFGVSVSESVTTAFPQSMSTEADLPVFSLVTTSPRPQKKASLDISSDSSASPPSGSPTAAIDLNRLKRRSKSTPQLHSILKRGESSGTASDIVSSRASVLSRPWARKAGRSVRVQSHRASNVEGDYAAFLKRASRAGCYGNTFDGMPGDASSDKQSVRSRKSGRSVNSRHSGKSGIENGCFRRGSMSSIKTSRTIATVGGVSVKDMSR